MNKAYEIRNPSFNDMNLERQIAVGVNDWEAVGKNGHRYVGRSQVEAEAQRRQYEPQAVPFMNVLGGPDTAKLIALVERVARLNPGCAEIGAGMLASLVQDAKDALAS